MLQVWDAGTFAAHCTLSEHLGHGGIVAFKWLPLSTHSSWLCTCSTDHTLRLFDAAAGRCLHTLVGHSDAVVSLDVKVDTVWGASSGQQLCVYSGSDDQMCRVFMVPLDGVRSGSPN